MPELPEVEHLRRTLEPRLTGRVVQAVRLARRDVLTGERGAGSRAVRQALLGGGRIEGARRLGKQLALVADDGRVLCVQLGMTGGMQVLSRGERMQPNDHVHCHWRLDDGQRFLFRDPRRFGGLRAYASVERLESERWSLLGPDALTIRADALARRLAATRRAIKAALLDQAVLAGVGNIYADEALFASRLHPERRASDLTPGATRDLAAQIRRTLRRAVDSGGSSLRDYVDASGRPGDFVRHHKVYGRTGEPCVRCGTILERCQVAQRTTVFCPACQGRVRTARPPRVRSV